ncbi:IS1595 family transposase, partial [Rodentibacter pneumotropicus]|uniref:IS1595 family transposase n=1 Tax=Rodentibacter pneumotropicus TaxID=758 RepID=UPI00232B0AD8
MAQHFLLTSQARMLSSYEIAQLSEEESHDLLCELRWGSKENVVCPKCGVQHIAYRIKTRNQWRCKHCQHTFSVTSGTIFANRKKPIKVYLYALMEWVNAVKGLSSLQLARNAKLNPRTAFVLSHKFRKALLES